MASREMGLYFAWRGLHLGLVRAVLASCGWHGGRGEAVLVSGRCVGADLGLLLYVASCVGGVGCVEPSCWPRVRVNGHGLTWHRGSCGEGAGGAASGAGGGLLGDVVLEDGRIGVRGVPGDGVGLGVEGLLGSG